MAAAAPTLSPAAYPRKVAAMTFIALLAPGASRHEEDLAGGFLTGLVGVRVALEGIHEDLTVPATSARCGPGPGSLSAGPRGETGTSTSAMAG